MENVFKNAQLVVLYVIQDQYIQFKRKNVLNVHKIACIVIKNVLNANLDIY